MCTGNTCRSPFAEAILKRLTSAAGRTDVEVASAGTQARNGSPASDEALLVGLERSLDLSDHRSRTVTQAILDANDLVLGMTESHVAHVKQLRPASNVHLLTTFCSGPASFRTIPDPYGGDLVTYRATADELERELGLILGRLSE